MSNDLKNQKEDYEKFMEQAIIEAQKGYERGEVPVGAVVVYNNRIIGKGYNMVESLQDATAHAEIIAITSASEYMGNWRLEKSSIYVTVEPCLMCLGAILQSRITNLIYGVSQPEFGAFSVYSVSIEKLNVVCGIKEGVIKELMRNFFKELRAKKVREGQR